jgi:hypothetical protein
MLLRRLMATSFFGNDHMLLHTLFIPWWNPLGIPLDEHRAVFHRTGAHVTFVKSAKAVLAF